MDANLLRRKQLENDLRSAIENDELELAYQPIVNNSGETILGVEALCRWTHPQRGEITPVEFIPVAENSGLIVPLGELVLRRACLDAKAWPGIFIAVNVSPLQFRRTDFVDVVERILAEPASIHPGSSSKSPKARSSAMWIRRSSRCSGSRRWACGLRSTISAPAIRACNICAASRSTSSRSTSSFVRSIERAADAAAIVHAVVSLGRGLGMKVTAEGVETAEQHLFLRAAGVHSLQGYRFGPPGAAAHMTARLAGAWLASRSPTTTVSQWPVDLARSEQALIGPPSATGASELAPAVKWTAVPAPSRR